MAGEEGALLVQIPQRLFLDFIAAKPRTLQIYLQKVPPWPPFRLVVAVIAVVRCIAYVQQCVNVKCDRTYSGPFRGCRSFEVLERLDDLPYWQWLCKLQAMARLWRVAHFVCNDFLDMPLSIATAAGAAVGSGSCRQRRRQEPQQSAPAAAQSAQQHGRRGSAAGRATFRQLFACPKSWLCTSV